MMRGILGSGIRYFVGASILLALWQSYNGDVGAILWVAWGYIQQGADIAREIGSSIFTRS